MRGHAQHQQPGSPGHRGIQFGGRWPSDDAMTLMLLTGGLLSLGIISVPAVARAVAAWLVAHRLLVRAGEAVIPLFGGAGLDAARLIGLLGLLVLAVAAWVWWRIRRRVIAVAKEGARPAGVISD